MAEKKNRSDIEDAHYRGWHLARTPHDALTTEFEWTLLRFQQAFERWVDLLGSITGMGDLSYTEIVVLHVIGMQDRPKTGASIARQLNRDDLPNIQYCIRKLVKHGFCQRAGGNGKTRSYELTKQGREAASDYAKLREALLTDQTKSIGDIDERLRSAAQLVSLLTGVYDEAGRISASYSPLREEKS